MIKVLIIEDHLHFALRTERILKKYFKVRKKEFQIEIKHENFTQLDIHQWYDLIFLDIDLQSEVNGLDIAKEIRKNQMAGDIIFVSCRQHLVFDTLVMQPLYFVRKTQYIKDMEIAIGLIDDILKKNPQVTLTVHGRRHTIKVDDIYYIEMINHDAIIYLRDRTLEIPSSMDKILEKINATHLIQIHRSYAVNMKYIDVITNGQIILSNQTKLPIGRTFKQTFLDKYQKQL